MRAYCGQAYAICDDIPFEEQRMNFSIRIKFFIVLLAFSLGPMVISRTLMGRQAEKMADQISGETRDEMLKIVSADLQSNAISFMNLLDSRGKNMALSVQMIAHEVERVLMEDAPASPAELYFASNFSPGGKAPDDSLEGEDYVRRVRGGKLMPMLISMDEPAFRLPQHGDPEEFLEQAQKLRRLTPIMESGLGLLGLRSAWLNVGLESGLFVTYPGHGFFPMHYDHRIQKWYKNTRNAIRDVVWTAPVVDPASRMTVAVASYPIRNPRGEFVGAASLDVPVSRIIEEVSLKSRWSNQIESFMVKYVQADDNHDERLLILAQDGYDEGKRRHWMSDIEVETMNSDDVDGFKDFLKRLNTETSGVVNLPYKGRDCFWAFASNENISFLLIAPNDVVAELPNEMASTIDYFFDGIRNISSIVSGVILILVGLIAWFGSKAVTRPLLDMANAAKRLAGGDTSVRIDIQTGDERDDLINSFNDMVPKLKEHLDMSRDMELAHEVQNLLLPRTVPALPGFDIVGKIEFCDQTGGDYYDFIEMECDEGRALGVVLGDVSGHGVPSALVMATARGQLHSLSKMDMNPKERIQAINTVLSRDLDGTGRFITMFYLRLCEGDSVVRWVRAGHDPAIRYNPTLDEFSELNGEGLALGVLEEFEYQEYEATLAEGEVLTLATDGVWEARNSDGEMFGKERMLAIIKKNAHYNAETIRQAIMDAVEAYHVGGQEDDIAVVVIRKIQNVASNTISFRMTNKENCFKCFQPKVEIFGQENELSPKVVFHLTLVLDELVTNIISYGYADFDEHPIDVTIVLDEELLTITVEDDAEPFNILKAPEPELGTPLDERDRQVGGMGVHLVKAMVHRINYERKDNKNILTLTKDISKHCAPGIGQG